MPSNNQTTPTIFVQIASYRDVECQHTVKDLFEKATHPERVFVGICWQYDPEEDSGCFEIKSPLPHNVRISEHHWRESNGVCWARHQAQKLYNGEDYVLMVDSHMRFVEDWDTLLIKELADCDAKKPLISCHPASYTPPNNLEINSKPTIMWVDGFTENGDVRCKGRLIGFEPDKPVRGAFVAAGFIFARGDVIKEVPYDPFIYFNEEEVLFSVKLYTHGWDVFSARRQYLYHYYNSGKAEEKRPTHWDNHKGWGKVQDASILRFRHLLNILPTEDANALHDIDLYSIGKQRSIEDFEAYSGLDFKKRTVNSQAPYWLDIQNLDLARQQDKNKHASYAASTPPPEVLVVENFISAAMCKMLCDYADSRVGAKLGVVDPASGKGVDSPGRVTDRVNIDGKPGEILSLFNIIYASAMESFFKVKFEWYERPQILRYSPGGKYNQHADAEHWVPEIKNWVRAHDRDFSVLLYLNDEYEGGELEFTAFNYKIKPKAGMLIGFPSDHRYLHAALPTLSGTRYVIVSWGAILGSKRVHEKAPYASVLLRIKGAS
jgi:hypothetical protein